MSVENVKKFYEVLTKDEALKQKFMDLSKKHQGKPMDEAKAMELAELEYLPLAKQMGFEFTLDDLRSYSDQVKQGCQGAELNEEEMKAVAGGVFVCVFIGAGDKTDFTSRPIAFCVLVGADCEQNMCCIIGVTSETK